MKARVSYLTILKRKILSLPLKDETDQFVICLVLPECLSVKTVVGGVSVSIHYCREISEYFSSRYKQWPLARKKISCKAICSRHQRESAPSRFGARVRY